MYGRRGDEENGGRRGRRENEDGSEVGKEGRERGRERGRKGGDGRRGGEVLMVEKHGYMM